MKKGKLTNEIDNRFCQAKNTKRALFALFSFLSVLLGHVVFQAAIPLQQLLDDVAITVSELSRRANVDYRTARKAVEGTGPIQRVKVLALLRVINELLGTSYKLEDIDDLEID